MRQREGSVSAREGNQLLQATSKRKKQTTNVKKKQKAKPLQLLQAIRVPREVGREGQAPGPGHDAPARLDQLARLGRDASKKGAAQEAGGVRRDGGETGRHAPKQS